MHARQELMQTITPTNIVGDAEASWVPPFAFIMGATLRIDSLLES
jgi:hypothetical protein